VALSLGGGDPFSERTGQGLHFKRLLPSCGDHCLPQGPRVFGDGQMAIMFSVFTVLCCGRTDHVAPRVLRKTGFEVSEVAEFFLRSNFCLGKAQNSFGLHLAPPLDLPPQRSIRVSSSCRYGPEARAFRKPFQTSAVGLKPCFRRPVRHRRVLDVWTGSLSLSSSPC